MSALKINRSIHKWGSVLIAIPLLVVVVTGILLLVRKEFSVLQPPTMRGINDVPTISFAHILDQVKTVEQAQIDNWDAIDRLDVRPSKGVIKVRAKSSWEIQLDSQTGEILQVAYRRSDLIESIHDGTFFQESANLWLMLPAALGLFTMLVTGLVLFIQPYYKKYKKRNS